MEYENEKVFTYVEHLLKGERLKDYSIGVFARHHDQINAKLTELKISLSNIIRRAGTTSC